MVNMKVGEILLEKPKNLRIENFSAVKRFVAEEMIKYENPYPYLEGLILRVTSRIKVVKMEERERGDNNTTGYTFKKSLALFANGFTAFSVKPLRIATFTGVVAAFMGFIGAIITIIRKLVGSISIAGYLRFNNGNPTYYWRIDTYVFGTAWRIHRTHLYQSE